MPPVDTTPVGGIRLAAALGMIEQPSKPDVPSVPDPLTRPHPGNAPVPPGELEGDETPDTHSVPPPTDPEPEPPAI